MFNFEINVSFLKHYMFSKGMTINELSKALDLNFITVKSLLHKEGYKPRLSVIKTLLEYFVKNGNYSPEDVFSSIDEDVKEYVYRTYASKKKV